MARVLNGSFYVTKPGGELFLVEEGWTEAEVQEVAPYASEQLTADHVWKEVNDKDLAAAQSQQEPTGYESAARIAELEAEVGRLQQENINLQATVDELRGQQTDDEGTGEPTSLPDNLDTLKKGELKALAEERGVAVDDNDTNAQIVEKLKAAASGSGS